MARAAATLAGLIALWFVLAPRADSVGAIAIGTAAAVAAFGASRWLFGAPPASQGRPLRVGKFKGGDGLIRAALAPEQLKPGFVKIKARDAGMCAALARAAGTNGAVIVEVEADGLLVHATDEDAIEAFGRAVERDAA